MGDNKKDKTNSINKSPKKWFFSCDIRPRSQQQQLPMTSQMEETMLTPGVGQSELASVIAENQKLKISLEEMKKIIDELKNEVVGLKKQPESEEYFTDSDQLSKDTQWIVQKNKKTEKKTEQRAKRARHEVSSSDSSTPAKKDGGAQKTTQQVVKTKKEPPPPPIMVSEVNDLKQLNAELKKENLMDKISIKLINNKCFKINTNDVDTYRATSKVLNEKHFLWHSYENKQIRPIRVMVKNLHHSNDPEEIKEDLRNKGLKIIEVANKLSYKEKNPLNMFILSFEHDENIEHIFKVKHILSTIVEIEPLRSTKLIPQCKRCQAFGHTQKYCHKETRCVKCLKIHLTKDCDKPQNQMPKCVNCGEEHPANYRGCVVAKELQKIKTRKEKKPTNLQAKTRKGDPIRATAHKIVDPSTTYAKVAASGTTNTQDELKETLQTILQKLNSFDERLKRLENSGKGAIPKTKP